MSPLLRAKPPYGPSFYERGWALSEESARQVAPLVLELLTPSSALDVGCGTGAWLSVLRQQGVPDVLGVDGHYLNPAQLLIPEHMFRPHDLEVPLELNRTFDLVMCLEVAEHLPDGCADTLVESLIRHGEVLLFSAATPGQGGTHHVNERWLSYWAEKFSDRGYQLLDLIRPVLWRRAEIAVWYRQNLVLFATPARAKGLLERAPSSWPTQLVDVVHPDLFASSTSFEGSLGRLLRPFPVLHSVATLGRRSFQLAQSGINQRAGRK